MNDFRKQQSAKILATYGIGFEDLDFSELRKGGEGSRGGKVIGRTKSGKPIYDVKGHKSYKDFSQDDHSDAMDAHELEKKKHPLWNGNERLNHNDENHDKHDELSNYHYKKFKALQEGVKNYKEGSLREDRTPRSIR